MKKKPKVRKPQTASKKTPSSKAPISLMVSSSKSIRIDRNFQIPDGVREALRRLHARGYVAYLVGGCVRDFLLERYTKDYDIATDAKPDEIVEIFPDSIEVGKAFGVIKVSLSSFQSRTRQSNIITKMEGNTKVESGWVEIATFREDADYQDHRHPKTVRFSNPAGDASRRDFTINALYFDLKSSRVYDFFDGFTDLKNNVIRAIGDPEVRFQEDALRLIRAIRFSSVLVDQRGSPFRIEERTFQAILKKARLIVHVSMERIREELKNILLGSDPVFGLTLLESSGLLEEILPELVKQKQVLQSPSYQSEILQWQSRDVNPSASLAVQSSYQGTLWDHTLQMFNQLCRMESERTAVLAFAVLWHGCGKVVVSARNQRQDFNGHEVEAAKIAEKLCERFRLPREESQFIGTILENQLKIREVFQMREAVLERWIREPYFPDFLKFHRIDALSGDGNLAYYDFCLSRLEAVNASIPKLISGEDLIGIGFEPGPSFSNMLRIVEDLAIEGKLKDKAEALEYVVKNFVR